MRFVLVGITFFTMGCATAVQRHTGPGPVNWSLTSGVRARSGEVCRSGESTPCVLQATTADRRVHATFTIHVGSKEPRRFEGTLETGFFGHPDPHKVISKVDLSSKGHDIHTSVTERVTSVPGTYYARIRLQETGAGMTPRAHDVDVPIQVK